MSGFILGWTVIGSVIMLLYIVLFLDIESHLAGKLWADPVVNLFIIVLWPIAILAFIWRRSVGKQPRSH